VLAITQGPHWGWSSPGVVGTLVLSVLLGAAFLYRCVHHPEPVLDLSLFRARTFSVARSSALRIDGTVLTSRPPMSTCTVN